MNKSSTERSISCSFLTINILLHFYNIQPPLHRWTFFTLLLSQHPIQRSILLKLLSKCNLFSLKKYPFHSPSKWIMTKVISTFSKPAFLVAPDRVVVVMQSPARAVRRTQNQSLRLFPFLKMQNSNLHHQSLKQKYNQRIFLQVMSQTSSLPRVSP